MEFRRIPTPGTHLPPVRTNDCAVEYVALANRVHSAVAFSTYTSSNAQAPGAKPGSHVKVEAVVGMPLPNLAMPQLAPPLVDATATRPDPNTRMDLMMVAVGPITVE